jgi:23S rRNA (adenine2503-C2)-methyltransferase
VSQGFNSSPARSIQQAGVFEKLSTMWDNIKAIQSSDENVMKFVFEKENAVAESVLYKYPTYEDRTVICCSTQSGCPVGCRFCGAGDYFVRSLTAEEIVSQPDYLLRHAGIDAANIDKLQIMVMSMGEPLLNFKNLEAAFQILYKKYPNARLLISTIGPIIDYEPVLEMCERIETVGLQFSIHESTDERRNKLIPFVKKLTLDQISGIGEFFYARTGRKPFFNYCAHELNNTDEDAENLYRIFNPMVWEATISVICERDESIAAANERQKYLAARFMDRLSERGYSTRMFDPAGQDDIGGGCGQLWFVQQWMKDNPDKARPSIGYGKEIIHTPTL